MAKGNMLLGMSRGSVGDVTFYRSGGSQRARARNRKPANPMTVRQQTQRAKFANAVKFHKQVTSNFFRFAYEDKKVNESDYNAFMRHNVGNSGFIGAKASKIASWPALGLWEVTSGSLPDINDVTFSSGEAKITSTIADVLDEYTTVGQLSAALIAGNDWREGDIFTILLYNVSAAATLPTVDTETEHIAKSAFCQFILSSTDTTPLADVKLTIGEYEFSLFTDISAIGLSAEGTAAVTSFTTDLYQAAFIHSRNTSGGLLVSTATMVANKPQLITDALAEDGTYYNAVLADWDAAAEAVLQGGAAAN